MPGRHRRTKETKETCGDRCPQCGKSCTLAKVHLSRHVCDNGHRWD